MTISSRDRFMALRRDGFTCQYCGRKPPEVRLHVDHVHPRSKGGRNELDNYVTACSECNQGKGAHVILPDPAPAFGEDDLCFFCYGEPDYILDIPGGVGPRAVCSTCVLTALHVLWVALTPTSSDISCSYCGGPASLPDERPTESVLFEPFMLRGGTLDIADGNWCGRCPRPDDRPLPHLVSVGDNA